MEDWVEGPYGHMANVSLYCDGKFVLNERITRMALVHDGIYPTKPGDKFRRRGQRYVLVKVDELPDSADGAANVLIHATTHVIKTVVDKKRKQ